MATRLVLENCSLSPFGEKVSVRVFFKGAVRPSSFLTDPPGMDSVLIHAEEEKCSEEELVVFYCLLVEEKSKEKQSEYCMTFKFLS